MKPTVHRSAVLALVLASGCAGASMGRAVDDDGGLATGDDSSTGGTLPTTLDPSGDPSSDPGSSDGADGEPSTGTPGESSGEPPGTSTDGGEHGSESSSDDAGSSTGAQTSSSEGVAVESSSDDGDETSPIDTVDLSGYTVVQTASARELVLPDDTLVPFGGCLVIGRNASPGAFQAFWGMNWGDEVVYIDGADDFPSINGDETFSLRSAADVLVEGPTPAIDAETAVWRGDADDVDSWNVDDTPNTTSTPGVSDATGGSSGMPYLSEYSDPTGAGNFAYEFVEICVAP